MNIEVNTSDQIAVDVRNVSFSYRNNIEVLKNLSVSIPQGEIFALLGSNGCGKTTLLKLISGIFPTQSGSIRVFGTEPNSKGSDIPGLGVGYMPQEIALFPELTIRETLIYFGIIYHLSLDEVNVRIKHLLELLNLPGKDRRVGQLSGGQQRLTSIAATMIHSPNLIILDEPTVGVDSLLRCRIWEYLVEKCRLLGKTVIITTHYIEEANRAATVGFMKAGSILKQANPQKLIFLYRCETLEEVYLTLWKQNDQMIQKRRKSAKIMIESNLTNHLANYEPQRRSSKRHNTNKSIDWIRIKGLLWKYLISNKRNPWFLILFNIIPIFAVTTLHFSLGQLPYDIPVAVYNAEPEPQLSKQFMNLIDKRYIHLYEYKSNESAIDSVYKGKNIFALTFDQNFSVNFRQRIQNSIIKKNFEMSAKEIDSSTIKLYADFSNSIIGLYGVHYFGETFLQFINILSTSLGYNPRRFSLPFDIQKPIYGHDNNIITGNKLDNFKSFTDFISPGLLIILFHLLSMAYSAFLIIFDRQDSYLDRYYVVGGQAIEILITHYIKLAVVIIPQVLMSMIFTFVIFETTQYGSYIEVFLLCYLQALQGMSIGLFISLLFHNEITVAIALSALMFPIWIMAGVFWPLEAIPTYFRIVADWTPITKPIDAMRSIMKRGWTFHNYNVLIGYIVSISYTIILNIFNVLLCKSFSFSFTLENCF